MKINKTMFTVTACKYKQPNLNRQIHMISKPLSAQKRKQVIILTCMAYETDSPTSPLLRSGVATANKAAARTTKFPINSKWKPSHL